MTAHTSVAVGLSIGSTMLAAVTATGAVTGPPLLTRAGRPIDDFVERVGDPVGIIAAEDTGTATAKSAAHNQSLRSFMMG